MSNLTLYGLPARGVNMARSPYSVKFDTVRAPGLGGALDEEGFDVPLLVPEPHPAFGLPARAFQCRTGMLEDQPEMPAPQHFLDKDVSYRGTRIWSRLGDNYTTHFMMCVAGSFLRLSKHYWN